MDVRVNGLLANDFGSVESVLVAAREKGERQGMLLVLSLPETLLETLDEDIEALQEQIANEEENE